MSVAMIWASELGETRTASPASSSKTRSRPAVVALLVEELAQRDGLGSHGRGLRGRQEFGDHAGQAFDLLQARCGLFAHVLPVREVLDLLQPHRQGRQRGPQLVGGVGGELAFGGDAAGHAVGRPNQLLVDEVDLLDARLLHPGPGLAGPDLLGGGR